MSSSKGFRARGLAPPTSPELDRVDNLRRRDGLDIERELEAHRGVETRLLSRECVALGRVLVESGVLSIPNASNMSAEASTSGVVVKFKQVPVEYVVQLTRGPGCVSGLPSVTKDDAISFTVAETDAAGVPFDPLAVGLDLFVTVHGRFT